jgi:hypothetical protein
VWRPPAIDGRLYFENAGWWAKREEMGASKKAEKQTKYRGSLLAH